MKIKTDEITSVIKKEIEQFSQKLEVSEVGQVVEVGDGIARVYGLSKVMSGELVEFDAEGGVITGQVMNLETDMVGAVLFGEANRVREGDTVRSTGRLLEVPAGPELLGRVVDPLGNAIDGGPAIKATTTMKVDIVAPGIKERQPVKEPLQFGIKAVDSMIPVGRGQRELVIGDRKTGKTAVCLDAIINQKKYWGTPDAVVCVYVAVGQKESTIAGVVDTLKKNGAMEYTIVVAAGAGTSAPMQYIAPYAGCAMGEYFLYKGGHALVVYDDLTKQADAYRQMSLLVRRPPGREAFPGDVFYLHSRLLERAVKLSDELGGGSLTALPVIETQAGDVSAYIPTNVISITDGQIFLETSLFFQGVRPAINVGLSVSRVGSNAQTKAMKKVAGRLKLELAQFRALEAFAQFASELDAATLAQINRGQRLVKTLNQNQYDPWPIEEQVAVIWATTNGHVDGIAVDDVSRFNDGLRQSLRAEKTVLAAIRESLDLSDDTVTKLKAAVEQFAAGFQGSATTAGATA